MSVRTQTATATSIRKLAQMHGVAYVRTQSDALANHITRLAGDNVELDEIEQWLHHFAPRRTPQTDRVRTPAS